MRQRDIWRVRIPFAPGHAQAGERPALIIQNDAFLPPLPTVLILNHGFDGTHAGCIEDATGQAAGAANVLELRALDSHLELSVPSIPGHPTLRFPPAAVHDLSTFLHACSVCRIHLQHWIGIGPLLHELIGRMGVPVDLTVHDYFSA